MLYAFDLYNVVCQLYRNNKARNKREGLGLNRISKTGIRETKNVATSFQQCTWGRVYWFMDLKMGLFSRHSFHFNPQVSYIWGWLGSWNRPHDFGIGKQPYEVAVSLEDSLQEESAHIKGLESSPKEALLIYTNKTAFWFVQHYHVILVFIVIRLKLSGYTERQGAEKLRAQIWNVVITLRWGWINHY